jgi:hypothetical protein
MLNKDMNRRMKPVKGENKGSKVSGSVHNTEVSKDCQTCQNPRHDKTARKS